MLSRRTIAKTVFGAACLLTGLAPLAASAQSFSGRVELIVPYEEGSGSTIHARLFAPPLEEHLPGKPTILIENVPGAGSVKGINQFAQKAKPDGMMIASLGTGTFFQYLLKDPAVRYPLPKLRPFLTSPFGLVVYARKDLGLTGDTLADIKKLRDNPPVYGGANATSSDLPAIYSIGLLGIKAKTVFGMSNAEARSGFERGELNINYDNMASWAEAVKPLVDDGTAVPLFTFGFEKDGKIVRDPMVPDVPTFLEVYEKVNGKPLSGMEYDVWKTLFAIRVMGSKMLALPADTPQNIYDAYVTAIKAALDSPALKGESAKLVLGSYPQSVGKESEAILKNAVSMDDDQRTWLKKWLKDTYNVQ
jgi:tripartite-type tricarboxylate transporter receptor subunit TctC